MDTWSKPLRFCSVYRKAFQIAFSHQDKTLQSKEIAQRRAKTIKRDVQVAKDDDFSLLWRDPNSYQREEQTRRVAH